MMLVPICRTFIANIWVEIMFESMSVIVVYHDLECPICLSKHDRFLDDCEANEVYCVDCHHWFEVGFQIHSSED